MKSSTVISAAAALLFCILTNGFNLILTSNGQNLLKLSKCCKGEQDLQAVHRLSTGDTKLNSIISSSEYIYAGKPKNKFQSFVQKLHLNEKQNQLFYDFCLSILSCLVGVLTTLLVVLSRQSISFIDLNWRRAHPIALPVLGSIIVCSFYRFDGGVGNSPFTPDYLRSNFDANSARYVGGFLDSNSPIQFLYHHKEDAIKEQSPKLFSVFRQFLRLVAVIIGIGSGCSLGFTGPAAELGMSISHILGYFLPEYASKDRSAVSYTTSPTGELTVTPANGNAQTNGQFKMYDEVYSNYNANRKYYLLLAGAGAGIAANFNAPLTGAMYSMEITKLLFLSQNKSPTIENGKEIKKDENGKSKSLIDMEESVNEVFNENDYRYLNINRGKSSALLLAASAAALAVRGGLMIGSKKILASNIDVQLLPSSAIEIPLFLAMGILSGSLSFVYFSMKQKFFRLFSVLPIYFRPLVGGVSCAVAAAFGSPQSLSVGYATLNRILSGELKNAALLSNFMIGKLIMVAISASSGLIGGQFAPSLFLGASLGAIFYQLSVFLFPTFVIHNFSVYVLVGAASMLAGTFRAPLTGTLLIIELTKQLDLTLPLLVSTGMASLVSKILTRV